MTTIHLQGIGRACAKPAGELLAGDKIMFNYGYIYSVTAVRDVAAKTVEVDMVGPAGKTYTQRYRKTRLVSA